MTGWTTDTLPALASAIISAATLVAQLAVGVTYGARERRLERLSAAISTTNGDSIARRQLVDIQTFLIDGIWQRHVDRRLIFWIRVCTAFMVPAFISSATALVFPKFWDGLTNEISMEFILLAVLSLTLAVKAGVASGNPAFVPRGAIVPPRRPPARRRQRSKDDS